MSGDADALAALVVVMTDARYEAEQANSDRIVNCHPNRKGWDQAKWQHEHPFVDVDLAVASAVLASEPFRAALAEARAQGARDALAAIETHATVHPAVGNVQQMDDPYRRGDRS